MHKATWVSPDLMTKNQIDRVCIGNKFRRSLEDALVRTGVDVASSTISWAPVEEWVGQTLRKP